MGALAFGAQVVSVLLATTAYGQDAEPPVARPEFADPGTLIVPAPESVLTPAADARPTPAAEPGPAEDAFLVREIRVAGANVYGGEVFAPILRPLEGRRATLAELEAAAEAIEALYRDKGYILTSAFVPPQEVEEGVVLLQVVEGYVGAVDIRAETPALEARLRAVADDLLALRPFDLRRLESELLLVRDLPGVAASAVIEALPGERGASLLTLEAEQDAADGVVTVDNAGSEAAGPGRLLVGVTENGLISPRGETTLQAAAGVPASETGELLYASLDHTEFLGRRGAALTLEASFTRTRPGGLLDDLDVESRTIEAGAGLSFPLIRSRAETLRARGGLSRIATKTTLLDEPLTEDRIWAASGGLEYDVAHSGGATRVALDLSRGLGSLGEAPRRELASRADGEADFWLVSGEMARLQSLGPRTTLFAAARGQYALSPLLAPLEVGFGGGQIGRAFDPSAILGDSGAGGVAELRYHDPLPLPEAFRHDVFVSLDGAAVWEKSEGARETLASAAAGFRLELPHDLSGEVQIAHGVAFDAEGEREEETRAVFRLTKRF